MNITVAGIRKQVPADTTIADLIVSEGVETPEYVTVSVNDDFAEQSAFATTALREGDSVEFLYFMGGGKLDIRF
ncbi:MAG: sulfur carrier protein ThiS [Oscillospiraceae bacterium]|jgi:sulfur carrier protein|nr:sulfur carrier protein ThiS [Oscillospiraceae bacterium]